MAKSISVDPATLTLRESKRIFQGLVIPRPIAFITSVSAAGVTNAAPFSFFNMMSVDPPVCAFGIEEQDGGGLKDTAANILSEGVFVVNLVDEALGERMNQCATEFPPGTSEADELGLQLLPGVKVKAPRIAAAPASFECRLREKVPLGPDHYVYLGDVVYVHIREGIVDPLNFYADLVVYRPLARLSGSLYSSLAEPFTHQRLNYEQWRARKAEK
jgi:flavin reductase (DIM6/NTAB) family NADH-FMN oxidoreductase RutF